MRAEGGRRLRVLYPGRKNSSAGPDFRDAVVYEEGVGEVELVEILERAGDLRFQQKCESFAELLSAEPGDQVLYSSIMEGLGYSQNRAQFMELAGRLTYATLHKAAQTWPPELKAINLAELLRREAGFEGSENEDTTRPHNRRRRRMGRDQWHLFRVRPGNHPRVRMDGAAALVARYLEPGLSNGITGLIKDAPGPLEKGLMVETKGDNAVAPIGRGRARDMAVNVVLPFTYAIGRKGGDLDLARATTSLYHRYPKLQDNEATREMKRELMPPGWHHLVAGARRQQGLMHLARLVAAGPPHNRG